MKKIIATLLTLGLVAAFSTSAIAGDTPPDPEKPGVRNAYGKDQEKSNSGVGNGAEPDGWNEEGDMDPGNSGKNQAGKNSKEPV